MAEFASLALAIISLRKERAWSNFDDYSAKILFQGTSIYSWIGTLHPKGVEKSGIPESYVIISMFPIQPLSQVLSALQVSGGNAPG